MQQIFAQHLRAYTIRPGSTYKTSIAAPQLLANSGRTLVITPSYIGKHRKEEKQ